MTGAILVAVGATWGLGDIASRPPSRAASVAPAIGSGFLGCAAF